MHAKVFMPPKITEHPVKPQQWGVSWIFELSGDAQVLIAVVIKLSFGAARRRRTPNQGKT